MNINFLKLQKYRVSEYDDAWLMLIPVIGWIMLLMMLLGGNTISYRLQKRTFLIFWKTIKVYDKEQDAIRECNKLNGIHVHTIKRTFVKDMKFKGLRKRILKIEYCPDCGTILSKHYAPNGFEDYKDNQLKFAEACNIDLNEISLYE